MIPEEWKHIVETKNKFMISNYGRIKYSANNKIYPLYFIPQGYAYVSLRFYKQHKTFRVNVLVWDYFGYKDRKGHEVDHIDGDKTNNIISNLQLLSGRENTAKYWSKIQKHSKYVGITFHNNNNKWLSRIFINNKREHLGYYNCETSAYFAYLRRLKCHKDIT